MLQGQPPAPRPATPSRPSTPASPRSVAESPAPGVADPFGFGGGMAFVRGFGMPRGSGRSSAGPATPHALVAPPIGVAAEDTVLVAKRPTSARGRATPSALAALQVRAAAQLRSSRSACTSPTPSWNAMPPLAHHSASLHPRPQKAAGASTPTAAETSIPGFDEEDLEDLGMAPAARPSTAPSQSVARAAPADDAGGPPEDVRKMLESSESSDSASDSGSDFGAGGRGAGATRASPRADAGAVRQALRSPHPPQPATTPTAFLGKSRLGCVPRSSMCSSCALTGPGIQCAVPPRPQGHPEPGAGGRGGRDQRRRGRGVERELFGKARFHGHAARPVPGEAAPLTP